MHYSMAPPGLQLEEGSQRFISFLVGLLVFRFRTVTFKPEGCVFLVQNVWMCQRVCMHLQSDKYRESIPILFLFPTLPKTLIPSTPRWLVLNFTQGSCVTTGDLIQNLESAHTKYLCVQVRLILHFEVSVSVTTDFPVNWPQCQRP